MVKDYIHIEDILVELGSPNSELYAFLTENIYDPDMRFTTCIAQSSELTDTSCRVFFSFLYKERLALVGKFYLLEKQPEN